MKERILRPSTASRRGALNANQTPQTTTSTTTSSMDQSRGRSHPTLESSTVAYHAPSAQRSGSHTTIPSPSTVLGGLTPLRVPKPSEFFGLQAGYQRSAAPTHPSLQHLSGISGVSSIPQLPGLRQLTAASPTAQKEHQRRLRVIGRKMKRSTLQRRMEGGLDPSTPSMHPIPDDFLSLHQNTPSLGWGGLLDGLRSWYRGTTTDASPSSTPGVWPGPEQDVGVHLEFDTDVVDALVYTIGRWLGLNAEQLRDSPGLRTLVSRNIQWFRASPDWLKLTGLVLAKKLNQSLDCPPRSLTDTQRMLLLDRMVQQTQMTVTPPTPVLPDAETNGGSELPPVPEPPAKRKRKTDKTKPTKSGGKKATTPPSERKPKKSLSNPSSAPPVKKERKRSGLQAAAVRASAKTTPPKKQVRIATTPKTVGTKRPRAKTSKLRTLLVDPPSNASLDAVPMEVDPTHAPHQEGTDPTELLILSPPRLVLDETTSVDPM